MDYQEGLEKSHADSAERNCDRLGEKSCTKPRKLYEGSGKGRADRAVRRRKSYTKDPEKRRADTAAQGREIYKKDLEKSG